MAFNIIDLRKLGYTGRTPLQVHIPPLYVELPNTELPKYKNLLELLQFIPPIHHEFYCSIPHEKSTGRRMARQKIIIS
jgi:hypothetical protein